MKHILLAFAFMVAVAAKAQTTATSDDNTAEATATQSQITTSTTQEDNRYSNLVEFNYYIKNSKLHQFKNGQLRAVKIPVKFKNNSVLSPLGILKTSDGMTAQLKNGDSVDKDGIVTKYKKQ